METGRRRRHRPGCRGVDRLIGLAILVGRSVRPVDIRRQGHLTDAIEPRELERRFEVHRPSPLIAPLDENDLAPVIEHQPLADPGPSAGPEQALPRASIELAQEQQFKTAAGRSVGIEPRRNHPGVVEQQQITGLEKIGEIASPDGDRPPRRIRSTTSSLEVAPRRRLLRDEFGRQFEIEVIGSHRRIIKHPSIRHNENAEDSVDRVEQTIGRPSTKWVGAWCCCSCSRATARGTATGAAPAVSSIWWSSGEVRSSLSRSRRDRPISSAARSAPSTAKTDES